MTTASHSPCLFKARTSSSVGESETCVEPRERPRVLAIVPYSPNRIRVRTSATLSELTRHAEVDLVCLDDGGPMELPAEIRKFVVIPNASRIMRVFRVMVGLVLGRPIAQEFYNSGRLRHVIASLDLDQYDAVYVERLPVHSYLKHPKVIYDCQDCCSHLDRLMAKHGKGWERFLYALDAILLPRHERTACNAASLVLVTADREIHKLRKLGVTSPIEVWTHDCTVDLAPRILSSRERFIISFHGKLSYAANGLALRALSELVAPALDKSSFELRIIGKCPARLPKRFPNLKFTGFVPSIMDTIRYSDLCVFPLPVSVGFPNKAMESLAAGVPFIATAEVVEGLPNSKEILEKGIYVRDIRQFAEEIERYSRLSLSERQQISRLCYEYARRVYDSASAQGQWNRILGHASVAVGDRSVSNYSSERDVERSLPDI